MYAPDVLINVEVEEASHQLLVDFVEDQRLVLAQGECKQMQLWLSNAGTKPIRELWMVAGPEDEIWVSVNGASNLTGENFVAAVRVSSDV
jgi:hypothetical protein